MSGQYARLPDSKRNELIDNYRNGIIDPNYEVIPSKTTTGRVSYIFDILTREHPLVRPTGPIPYNRRKKVGVGSAVDCGNGVEPGYRRTINGRQLSRGAFPCGHVLFVTD